jgi:uncharacterized lipoprotein YbaY
MSTIPGRFGDALDSIDGLSIPGRDEALRVTSAPSAHGRGRSREDRKALASSGVEEEIMRDSATRAGSNEGIRPRSGFAKLVALGSTVLLVAAVGNLGAGCHSAGGSSSTPAQKKPEQSVSFMPSAEVGAERGEAEVLPAPAEVTSRETTESVASDRVASDSQTSELAVRVDLGSDEALPKGSELLLELSDLTLKDEPKPLATQTLDVSGQEGIVDVALTVPAKRLLAAERVSITGRISDRGEMRSISPVPLLVEGPFVLDGDVAKHQSGAAFEITLSEVPDYEKHHAPKPTRVRFVETRSVDTGTVEPVSAPESD